MKNTKSKKIFKCIIWVFGILTIVLVIHIYWVTKPKVPDSHTIVMARIDIKNSLNQEDANKIKIWLYQQKGIDHVVVNTKTQIAIFTFYPTKTSADQIVRNFKTSFNYDIKRFVPTKEEIANGCPALPPSVTQKISSFIKQNL